MDSAQFEIRLLGRQDAEDLLALSQSLGWDFTKKYWQVILSTGYAYGAFDQEGQLVGTASAISYPDTHCFVGAVIVAQKLQGCGLGKRLMTTLQAKMGELNLPAKLIATPEGVPLYERLGYQTVDWCYKMVRHTRPSKPVLTEIEGLICKPLNHELMSQICEYDKQYFGADRSHVLCALQEAGYSGVALLDKENAQVQGYAMMLTRPEQISIGPIVTQSAQHAMALCDLLAYGQSKSIRVDSLSYHQELRDLLQGVGYTLDTKSPLMILGDVKTHQDQKSVFAVTTQAFG